MLNQVCHRNKSTIRYFFLLFVFSFSQLSNLNLAFASDHTEKVSGPNSGIAFVPSIIKIIINYQPIDSSCLVLKDEQGSWILPADVLFKAKIRIPKDVNPISYEGGQYFPLSLFGNISSSFDESQQALTLSFDANSFEPNVVSGRPQPKINKVSDATGMFVNYDLLINGGSGQDSQSLFTEWGAAIVGGIGVVNLGWLRQDNHSEIIRIGTTYTKDYPENLSTWRLGDAISRPATTLGRPVRFGGIQYSTNFQIQPGLVTVPVPTLNGQAALPSIADLYINNVFQSSTSIPPGPFSITTAPIVSGDGEVLVRVRDITGREQLIGGKVYSSPALLASGLSDFSFELGSLRKNFGIEYNDYQGAFGSGSYRRGITDRLTLEAGVNALNSGLTGALGSATYAIPALGTASLAAGLSSVDGNMGLQYAASFERRSRKMSLALRMERADEGYRQIGVDPEFRVRALDTAFWSYRFDDIGSLGLSYARQERSGAAKTELIGVSFSTQRTYLGNFVISAFRSRDDDKNYSIGLFWILPIDGEWNASISQTKYHGSPDTTVFQAQKSAPYSEGFGWRVQAAVNAAQQAALIAQNAYGSARVEAGSYQGQDSARLAISGALANIDGRWFPTRKIGGSYGLVQLPGLSNVRVYVDNQLMTRTDENGDALLPRLHPYVGNHVSVEQMDLPLDTKIDALVLQPAPGWRSGLIIKFPIRKLAAATFRIVDSRGSEIPAGASLSINDSSETFAVGRDGLAYIEGLSSENIIHVRWPEHACDIYFSYAPEKELIPYLGEFECRNILK